MNLKEIRELIQLIEESSTVEEFEMERSGVRIRVKKALAASGSASDNERPALTATPEAQIPTSPELPIPEEETNLLFEAPMVGTFYITPKPDAEPFVKIGDPVGKGMVLCVIEAMKIFNQIESDVEGKIIKVLVENGQPVEYGQPLFEIQVTD
ncbi:MAG: acetyl-CoA carboxylase biotin carboxyl carrier protein [Acidobacteriota bacterium]